MPNVSEIRRFDAGIQVILTERILPAPESAYPVRIAIDEALVDEHVSVALAGSAIGVSKVLSI